MAPRRSRAGTPPHGRGRGDRTGADEFVRRGAHRGPARPRGPERARGRQRGGVSRGHRKIAAGAGANGAASPARRLRKDEDTRTDRPVLNEAIIVRADFPPAPKFDVYGELDSKKATPAELRGQVLFFG